MIHLFIFWWFIFQTIAVLILLYERAQKIARKRNAFVEYKDLISEIKRSPYDAGDDLKSDETCVIFARSSKMIKISCAYSIPAGYMGFIQHRSSVMLKGIFTWGIIDAGYTKQLECWVVNNSDKDVSVKRGDRIAQLVLLKCANIERKRISIDQPFTYDFRGNRGFGSTGN